MKGLQIEPPKCPRCDSLNTKFCYYNNYSLSQPRYLCKTCRRYWTQGGTLRNVPVGGGCRKAKRSKLSSDNSKLQPPPPPPPPPPPQIVASSLTTTTNSQHVVFSGAAVVTTPSFFNSGGDQILGSSSSWVNSFGSSSQGQCQIQAPEIIYEMMDQSLGKSAVSSSSPAGWPESYINNPISNPMIATGDAVVWTAGNPTNNSGSINQWPGYMAGFCPPP